MFTRAVGWGIAAVCVVAVAWSLINPIGFAKNPVMPYLRDVSISSSERFQH
jgi:hypothetical protein